VAAEPWNERFRDSRGIARARTGDRHGAIDDFQAFVAGAREKLNTRIGYQEVARLQDQIPQRERWIRALLANEDPLAPNLIDELRQR
jgi:hypothetical protein